MGFFSDLKDELDMAIDEIYAEGSDKKANNYGIFNFEKLDLKKFNVIIGKNGAGKTRLLKSIRDDFLHKNMTVIYAYFPDMNTHFKTDISSEEYELPLYEMIFENLDIRLDNFIQYIECQGYDFLCELLRDISQNLRYSKSYRKERAKNIHDELNTILESLINRTLIFESEIMVESNVTQTTKKLMDDLEQMSPGELSLFYLSILLIFIKYNKQDTSKTIVLLDEPELHLHPDALIKFMGFLKAEKTIATCCIATHSIFLIPSLDFYEIIFIKDSEIQPHDSKMYNEIFENIVGKHENISDYIISREMWQYYRFIAECFCLPNVVDKVNIKDEQFLKFNQYVNQIQEAQKNITVLDYGAGSGRLGKTIREVEKNGEKRVEYFYYDKYEKKPPKELNCCIYKDIEDIYKANQTFNCVVLMNVLHEIDVKEWLMIFQNIYNVLEPNGYLLIFEVISLLHGEQPYGDTGYILLGKSEMKKLFMTDSIEIINLKDTDKTNMFIIKRELLKNVCENSIIDALKTLRENLFKKLRREYKNRKKTAHTEENVSQQVIKNYGFLSQHYLNSIFAIEAMQAPSLTVQKSDSSLQKKTGSVKNGLSKSTHLPSAKKLFDDDDDEFEFEFLNIYDGNDN